MVHRTRAYNNSRLSEVTHRVFFNVISKVIIIVSALLLWGCSSTRHVPEGSYLVDHVNIEFTDSPDTEERVKESELINYLRQTPNHKVLGFLKLQLATYNMSGRDTSKWYNRWLRRLGQAPVIYSPQLTDMSERQLQLAMVNRGFMDATVEVDTVATAKKKLDVTYRITQGMPHTISSMSYDIPDEAIRKLVMRDSAQFTLHSGDLFNRDRLDSERTLITERLRNHGYYGFTKEYITFFADTAENSRDVVLTLTVRPPERAGTTHADSTAHHKQYRIRNVILDTDYSPGEPLDSIIATASDTSLYKSLTFVYGPDRYLLPSTLEEKCYIRPGDIYSARRLDRTYEALSQLGILKFINIEMRPVTDIDGVAWLDAYILMNRNKKQGVIFDLEGTNSEGDLGFGLGLTYQYRNLGHRSNLLTTKLRMNYESLSGNLSGLVNDRYTEYAAEVGITFPKFLFPFLKRTFTQRIKATTELALSGNYQERPEYTRIIAGAAWKYRWNRLNNSERRTFDLLDINYVYLPESTLDFLNQIAPSNPLLRYSYEDHFIMRSGYSYYRTNRRLPVAGSLQRMSIQPTVYSLRLSGEIAGNLLYAFSKLTDQRKSDEVYKVFGIAYSQYVKAEADYMVARNFTDRHSVAFHVGAGIGYPYGNSRVLPFEKRFYAGGANGVRGWGVRTLGPGCYDSRNSVTDFINQCGDIRLDLSAEYRMKLFWVFEGAFFIDAGNIWTIHNYENQPGGEFHFDTFWKQIALAYGAGLRLDFTYFLLRFDLGFKAHNPAMGQEKWPIIHPRWGRDTTFHFAVGYPF